MYGLMNGEMPNGMGCWDVMCTVLCSRHSARASALSVPSALERKGPRYYYQRYVQRWYVSYGQGGARMLTGGLYRRAPTTDERDEWAFRTLAVGSACEVASIITRSWWSAVAAAIAAVTVGVVMVLEGGNDQGKKLRNGLRGRQWIREWTPHSTVTAVVTTQSHGMAWHQANKWHTLLWEQWRIGMLYSGIAENAITREQKRNMHKCENVMDKKRRDLLIRGKGGISSVTGKGVGMSSVCQHEYGHSHNSQPTYSYCTK
ncbi:hypothetical protein BU24DRAFT_450858 [Aaosphaeria arxii CBS 175.79]|uniref:Uncharacterized protein n=1 Tax=Aaosphaeria arxii CBS 175.79 TaxID=1450172 RepID=A0A6A5XVN3_9PLEO|nr:uncharacterized protein BU24DRAFT_450858 [Aaosphaeria arxii CBS 175.79]KAF2016314.1 hypothetical protein BU24DRAFT_450858 [Aaosphaeria arxii CBS 175.79]